MIIFNLIEILILKVILNSTEWEITLHLHDFDESWMRYDLGRCSYVFIPNSLFKGVIFILGRSVEIF